MSHAKRSRVGKLPRWQRLSTHLIFALCALSGLAYLAVHELRWALPGLAPHDWLVLHGVSTYFALLAFGAVLPGHIRGAWNVRRNRGSGVAMIAVLALFMGSGLLLYYGPEEIHEAALWGHWVVGGLSVLAFPLHLVLGARANRRPLVALADDSADLLSHPVLAATQSHAGSSRRA